jgi:hypothetical protein
MIKIFAKRVERYKQKLTGSKNNSPPRRDAGAAARARRRPRAEPSTGVVEGPQGGGEARKGDASGGRSRRE